MSSTHVFFEPSKIVIQYKELRLVLQQITSYNTRTEHISAANSPSGAETWRYSIEKDGAGLAVERRAGSTVGILTLTTPLGSLKVEDFPAGLTEEVRRYIEDQAAVFGDS